MAKLVVKAGRSTGEEFALNSDRLILGRRSACPIPILDPKASREHAVVLRKDNDFFVQDLSRNGTFINGRAAAKTEPGTPLKFGDRIKIGETELEMVDEKSEPLPIDVPGYQIIDRIGSGGMGTVYKARQLSMDRIVALKVLNERYSSNGEFVDRFIREARAAGQLNHPNVIHVHDISRANGRHYFSMEFVDGQSVKELLRAEKKIEVNRALDIALQAAKALEFAHENKIVHRDVKPDNIMLTKEGIVKIADLGIAKTFEEQAASPKERRRVMGTPHYMAPEQALGKAIDHRVDIYSLGATLYHMVTGKTPFGGSTAGEILKAHIQESLPPIQDLNPKVPDPVCFMIERMMAKLPEKRYPDMTRVIADIERVQRGAVAGIDRIEAGESTITRALEKRKQEEEEDKEEREDKEEKKAKKDKKEDKKPKKEKKAKEQEEEEGDEEAEEKGDTAELPTGVQRRIPAYVLTGVLVLLFVGVVYGVVHFAQRFKPDTGEGVPVGPGPDDGSGTNAASHSNPEAKKLLQEAFAAQASNDPRLYDQNLKAIVEKYPTSPEAAEAKRLLQEAATQTQESARKNAEKLLSDAKAFEAANPTNLTDAIKRYGSAMEAAKNCQDIFEAAKTKVEALQKRVQEEQTKAVEAAFKAAVEAARTAKNRYDYDAARAALQEFINANGTAPQKADADTELGKINAEAQAKLKDATEGTANLDIAPALAAWNRYTAEVKDAVGAKEADTARQALETKADQLTQDELTKSADKAKKFNYADALTGIRAALKRVSGQKKWEEPLKAKEDALRKQKDLQDKFLASASEKLKAGPVPLNFNIETRFGDVKWKVSRVNNDQVSLDAMQAEKAPGIMKRLGELKPDEQYKLYLLFLPKELTPDDHKALVAFCQDRGLAAQAEIHTRRAAGGAEKEP